MRLRHTAGVLSEAMSTNSAVVSCGGEGRAAAAASARWVRRRSSTGLYVPRSRPSAACPTSLNKERAQLPLLQHATSLAAVGSPAARPSAGPRCSRCAAASSAPPGAAVGPEGRATCSWAAPCAACQRSSALGSATSMLRSSRTPSDQSEQADQGGKQLTASNAQLCHQRVTKRAPAGQAGPAGLSTAQLHWIGTALNSKRQQAHCESRSS